MNTTVSPTGLTAATICPLPTQEALSADCCSATPFGNDFQGPTRRTDVANQKRKEKIIDGARMTKEEAELFINCIDLIRDAKGVPSRRRYFRSDGSIIAEAKW